MSIKRTLGAMVALACSMAAIKAVAQQEGAVDSELDVEMRYVQALQRNLFLDIADAVLKELTAKYPEAGVKAAQLQLEADLMRGKFDVVKEQIAAAEKAHKPEDIIWAMRLALADAYYSYARYDECSAIYGAFFAKYQKKDKDGKVTVDVPPSLASTFTNAAYKYVQMLIGMKKRAEAIALYKVLAKQPGLPNHIKRQCWGETAELCIALADEAKDKKVQEGYLVEADKIADNLLWEQDLWFGKAIVFKAHVLMVRDQVEEAQKLIDTYMVALQDIHKGLQAIEAETGEQVVRQSPMAECRYLLAKMQLEKAQALLEAEDFSAKDPQKREAVISLLLGAKDQTTGKRNGKGAFNHFLNVYVKYPESAWAADAGACTEQVRTLLEETFGSAPKSNITPERQAKVREIQYRDARALYRQGQIEEAKGRLQQVLNAFPDCEEAISALGDLARCYIQAVGRDADAQLYAETIVGHLAERFCDNPAWAQLAGDELIRVAEYWKECGRDDMRHATYSKFFALYPKHPSCVGMLTAFGEQAFKAEDYPHALEYYTIVANSYTNSPLALMALQRISGIYETQNDFSRLLPTLNEYIKRLESLPKPTQALYSTRYRKAAAIRGRAADAIRSATNETDTAKAAKVLAGAIKEFDDLITDLKTPPPSAEIDETERKQNATIREMSLYNKAFSLTLLPAKDDTTRNKMRKMAIDAYMQLVADYPKGETAPTALIQVGTLYMMMKDAEGAEAALSRLRRDYPDSEQAKSALPMIADSLMKMGEREGAIARYREMISSTGTDYSDTDVLRAATALIDAKEFDLARMALDKLLDKGEEGSATRIQARFAECRLLVAKGDNAGAVAKLQSFIADYPTLQLMVDAYAMLSGAASEAGLNEKDGDKRISFFDASIAAMKEVKKRRTNDLEQAQCDIDTGRIMARKARAEAEFGDKNRANDFLGKALISYQIFIDSIGSDQPRLLPLAETAYYEAIPLQMDRQLWDQVIDNCKNYLDRFPQGRYANQINAWRNQANNELQGAN